MLGHLIYRIYLFDNKQEGKYIPFIQLMKEVPHREVKGNFQDH